MPLNTILVPKRIRQLFFDLSVKSKFLSAASGLVQYEKKLYVIPDDELTLGVLDLASNTFSFETILQGSLPIDEILRKSLKPDFESLFVIDDARLPGVGLIAIGSGSTAKRSTGVFIPILIDGSVNSTQTIRFNLAPFFNTILEIYGQLNIEGSLIDEKKFVLFHRGNSKSDVSRIFEFNKSDLVDIILGLNTKLSIQPESSSVLDLAAIDGIPLSVTDVTIFEGRRFFIAAAEATTNAIDDGEVKGSVFGEILTSGRVRYIGTIPNQKTEGLSMRRVQNTVEIIMVTDNDEPLHPAELLEFVIDTSDLLK